MNMVLPSKPTKEQVEMMLLYAEAYLRARGFKELAKQVSNLLDEIKETL